MREYLAPVSLSASPDREALISSTTTLGSQREQVQRTWADYTWCVYMIPQDTRHFTEMNPQRSSSPQETSWFTSFQCGHGEWRLPNTCRTIQATNVPRIDSDSSITGRKATTRKHATSCPARSNISSPAASPVFAAHNRSSTPKTQSD